LTTERTNSIELEIQEVPVNFTDLHSLEICDWWTQFSEERSDDDGVLEVYDDTYQELISRGNEIDFETIKDLIRDEIVSGPFGVGLIMSLLPFKKDPYSQLELLQLGMSTLTEWPEMSFDGFHIDFLELMWKTLEVVDETILDSSDADSYVDRCLESDLFWLHPIVLTAIVALKSPNKLSLEKILNRFMEIWDVKSQSIIEDNKLDLNDNGYEELDSVAALMAVSVLSPNAPSALCTKILKITTWPDNADFGLAFWEYVCALTSRGNDSFFEAPNYAWRDGFFGNGLWHHQVSLSSKSELRCLTFYLENRNELNFQWPGTNEPRTQKEVLKLLSNHLEAGEEVKKVAVELLSELETAVDNPEPRKVQTMAATTFDSKALILGQVWMHHKDDDELAAFFKYNDIGVPLAFAYTEGIVTHTPSLETYVNETFDQLLDALAIEDSGFEDLQDLSECLEVLGGHQLN
jgi:hypothetical protein